MHERAFQIDGAPVRRFLVRDLTAYREPSSVRSVFELLITGVPFVLIWVLMWAVLEVGYWIALILRRPGGGFPSSPFHDPA